jgi:hypothetical protein
MPTQPLHSGVFLRDLMAALGITLHQTDLKTTQVTFKVVADAADDLIGERRLMASTTASDGVGSRRITRVASSGIKTGQAPGVVGGDRETRAQAKAATEAAIAAGHNTKKLSREGRPYSSSSSSSSLEWSHQSDEGTSVSGSSSGSGEEEEAPSPLSLLGFNRNNLSPRPCVRAKDAQCAPSLAMHQAFLLCST